MTPAEARAKLRASRAEIFKDQVAAAVYQLAILVISEQDAEIERLHEELAAVQGIPVLHATGAQCERIIELGMATAEAPGTLLRSTDDRRSWKWVGSIWQPR